MAEYKKHFSQTLLVVLTVFLLYGKEIVSWVNNNVNFIEALITAVLALFAYFSLRQNTELISEAKKERQVNDLPIIRVMSMSRKRRPYDPEFLAIHPESRDYYEVMVKNFSGGLAKVTLVELLDNTLGREAKKISNSGEQAIFPGEEFTFVDYEAPKPNTVAVRGQEYEVVVQPKKVYIEYSDRYGNVIKYTATSTSVASDPSPWLTVKEHIFHQYVYPPELV
jgi:hypothetical protein